MQNQQAFNAQDWFNYVDGDLQLLEQDARVDCLAFAQELAEEREVLVGNQTNRNRIIEESRRELRANDRKRADLWSEVEANAPRYFNQCLDSNFSEAWCLSHRACLKLKGVLIARMLERKDSKKLLELNLGRVRFRNRAHELETALEDRSHYLSDRLNNLLDQARLYGYVADLQTWDTKIARLEESLNRVEQACRKEEEQWLLRYIGQFEGENAAQTTTGPDTAALPVLQSPTSPREQSTNAAEELELLHSKYFQAREELARLQKQYNSERESLLFFESRHLITFTQSSSARYKKLMVDLQAELYEQIGQAEAHLYTTQQQILAISDSLPQSPQAAQPKPIGGGLDTDDKAPPPRPPAISRLLNRWRLDVNPKDLQGPPALPQKQNGTRLQSPGLDSGSSEAISPSCSRKRKLDAHVEEQESQRQRLIDGYSSAGLRYRRDSKGSPS